MRSKVSQTRTTTDGNAEGTADGVVFVGTFVVAAFAWTGNEGFCEGRMLVGK